jgi:hypothetical protein
MINELTQVYETYQIQEWMWSLWPLQSKHGRKNQPHWTTHRFQFNLYLW